MKNDKLAVLALRNSLGIIGYVWAVGWLMLHAQQIFGNQPGLTGFIGLLLLFCSSALVCGLLALGQPIWLFIRGDKADALKLVGLTASLLALATFGLMFFAALTRA